jgi:hypothetical protein
MSTSSRLSFLSAFLSFALIVSFIGFFVNLGPSIFQTVLVFLHVWILPSMDI